MIKRLKRSANQNRLHIRGKGIGKNYKEGGRGEDPCRFSIESVPLPYAPRYPCPFQRMYYTERNNPPFFSRRERTSPPTLSIFHRQRWLLAPAEFHRRHVPLWFMRLAVAKRRISPSSHFCFRWNMCSIRRNYLYAILPILFITHVIYSVLFGTQGFLDIGYGVNSFSLGF